MLNDAHLVAICAIQTPMLLVIWQQLTCQVSDLASTQGSWLAVAMGYAALAGICCCPLCSRSHDIEFGHECMRDARRKWWPSSLGRLGEVDFFWEGTQRLTRHFGMFEYSKRASSGTEWRNMRNKLHITTLYTRFGGLHFVLSFMTAGKVFLTSWLSCTMLTWPTKERRQVAQSHQIVAKHAN